jgi:hypothetical protein
MAIFEDVTLTWKGIDYVIEAKNVMMLLDKLEDHIVLADLQDRDRVPIARVSMAYAEALRFAGAKVAAEEVYQSVFSGDASETIYGAVAGLMVMMIPPEHFRVEEKAAKAPAKKKRQSKSTTS